jgi:hypothetical protein
VKATNGYDKGFRTQRMHDVRAISLAECRRGPFVVTSDKQASAAIATISAARLGDNAELLALHQAAVFALERGTADVIRARIEEYRVAVVASRETKGAA